ncbi:MAG: hypothetical protein HY689_01025 [Chloroflexi bacterium]|nr:hypothetical protein [Chloroflexota bacterium]
MHPVLSFRRSTIVLAGALMVGMGLSWWATGSAQAGTGPTLTTRYTSTPPTIDGTIGAGEWGPPLAITLNGFNDPTKTRSAELYVLYSATDLYVGLVFSEPSSASGDMVELDFDRNHDHNATAGSEDALRYEGGPVDLFWAGNDWARDTVQHGTVVRTFGGGKYTYEFRKPLNSGDAQDMAASPGTTLGFRFYTYDADISEGFRYPASSRAGGEVAVEWGKWADLSLAIPPRITTAPALATPAGGTQLAGMGTALSWTNPEGTTQNQIQVLPAKLDGPAINLIRNAETSFTIPAPAVGQGNYIMLPGMTYTWRVRATSKLTFAPENDPEWGPWAERTFRTGLRGSSRITLVSPADGATVGTGSQVLQWDNEDHDVFYYEIQVSGDTRFDPEPATATSFVWWNLTHGGQSDPLNSWRTPPLEAGQTYFWRVRPRVQGDGAPVDWSSVRSFKAQ